MTPGLKNEKTNLTIVTALDKGKKGFLCLPLCSTSLQPVNLFCSFFTSGVIHGKEFEINLFYKETDFLAMKQTNKTLDSHVYGILCNQ